MTSLVINDSGVLNFLNKNVKNLVVMNHQFRRPLFVYSEKKKITHLFLTLIKFIHSKAIKFEKNLPIIFIYNAIF